MVQLRHYLKSVLILFLLGVWSVYSPPATAQDETLTGWFTITVLDYPPESGRAAETTYFLTEDSGERYELLIDIELMRPLGGPWALNRKRVTVEGEWEEVEPDETEKFWVYSIDLAVSPPLASSGRPFAADVFPAKPAPPRSALFAAESDSHVRGSLVWLTILCRFADSGDEGLLPVSYFEEMMSSSYPGLGHYWNEVSYGNLDLDSIVRGWYTLPHPRSYYVAQGQGSDTRACSAAADVPNSILDFDGYWGVNTVIDGLITEGGVVAYGGNRGAALDATLSQDVWAHEMGHALGLPHSSGPYGGTYDSAWDVVSGGQSLDPQPGYGYLGVHTVAYHKDLLGWIPPDRKYVAAPNTTQTITLERLAQPGAEGYLMAQIPIGRSRTDFYTVEARLFAGYDDGIPGEAVVIHKVDTTREDRLAQVVDVDNNGNSNDEGAMWTEGEIFTDESNGVQISVDAEYATGFSVTIAYTVCAEAISSTRQLLRGHSGNARIRVVAPSGCRWGARSDSPWLRVIAGGGSGSGSVIYSVAANPSLNARIGTLIIGGRSVTVTQTGVNDNLFEDDMESELGSHSMNTSIPCDEEGCRCEAGSCWELTTASSHSRDHAWTDSPGSNYRNNQEVTLHSPLITLPEVTSATLTFWHRYDFGSGDSGSVLLYQPEPEDSSIWSPEHLRTFTGTNLSWEQVSIDLTPFIRQQQIYISFNMRSDASGTADGWYIDDVAVSWSESDFVVYDACTYTVSPTRASVGLEEERASVAVDAPSGCPWTAASQSPWLTITAGSSGTGPGQVRYTAAANPDATPRTGTLTIAGQTFTVTQEDIDAPLFADDMENGAGNWYAGGWELTTESSHSGTHAWTDSPGGNYQNDQYAGLSTNDGLSPIDLTGLTSATLTFWHRYAFASGDKGIVQVCVYDSPHHCLFVPLRTFTGSRPAWHQESFDLSPYIGKRIFLSFVLETDASGTADGWYIDDVAVFVPDSVTPEPTHARLENPSPKSSQSGLAAISGWVCDADKVEIELNGTRWIAGYGTRRVDTREVCGDTDNGFSLLYNWNLLGDGLHTVRAYADDVLFASTQVKVTTLGREMRRDIREDYIPIVDFPNSMDEFFLQWQESLQNFVITDGTSIPKTGFNTVPAVHGFLENPSLGASVSGIAALSGWVCDADKVEIELNSTRWQVGYGTSRTDTQGVCGNTDNGFSLLYNWNLLGDGTHTVRAYADDVLFAETQVKVTTLGREMVWNAEMIELIRMPVDDGSVEFVDVAWSETLQNFVIISDF